MQIYTVDDWQIATYKYLPLRQVVSKRVLFLSFFNIFLQLDVNSKIINSGLSRVPGELLTAFICLFLSGLIF
jgi:hypothetical protein